MVGHTIAVGNNRNAILYSLSTINNQINTSQFTKNTHTHTSFLLCIISIVRWLRTLNAQRATNIQMDTVQNKWVWLYARCSRFSRLNSIEHWALSNCEQWTYIKIFLPILYAHSPILHYIWNWILVLTCNLCAEFYSIHR